MTLFTVSSLSSCSIAEQKEKGRNAENESRTVFLDSIKEKYGFTADIEEIEAEYTYFFGPTFTGKVNITASYNEKTFYAYVEDGIVYDNYQASEIYDAMFKYVLDVLELPEPIFFLFNYSSRDSFEDDFYLDIYYDGTNVEECFNYISPDIDMAFETGITFKENFSEIVRTAFSYTKSMWMDITILNENSLNEAPGIEDNIRFPEYFAPYVDQVISYRYYESEGFSETIEDYALGSLSDYGIEELDSVLVLRSEESENLQFEKGMPSEG